MIHFDFIVDEIDAENIFDCIELEINRCISKKLRVGVTKDVSNWFDSHIAYLNELKSKMKNSKVIEEKIDIKNFSPKNQTLK